MNRRRTTDSRIEGLLRLADRRIRHIEHLFAYIAVFFIFTLMMLGVAGIAARQLSRISIFGHGFDITIFGYIDMVELLMTTFAFLAISHAERIGAHVRMDLMISRLRGRALWAFELFSVLAAIFLISVLIRYGIDHAIRAFDNGDSTMDADYPWWPSKAIVPIALSVLWVRLVVMGCDLLRLLVWPDREPIALPKRVDVTDQAQAEARETEMLR